MRGRIIIFIAVLFFFFVSSARAADKIKPTVTPTPIMVIEYNLPYPGLLPDHPLYFIKDLRDKILLATTRDPYKKSQQLLIIADKHLVMGQQLWEKQNYRLSMTTFTRGEEYLLKSVMILTDLKKTSNLPPGQVDKLEMAAKKHKEIMNKLLAATSDDKDVKGLNEAIAVSNQATQQLAVLK